MKNLMKAGALFLIAGTMMGNQSCQQEQAAEKRELRRRVQMGSVKAPIIQLPQGGQFDFQSVANIQMYDVLSKTKAFSTATVDPSAVYDPSGLSNEEAEQFNQCGDEEMMSVNGKLMAKSVLSQRAACMINLPQGVISGNILDFTLIGDNGVSVNISNFSQFSAGVGFRFKKYELAVAMRAQDPMVAGGNVAGDHMVLATTSQSAYGKESSVSLNLMFSMLGLGFDSYSKTPLHKVVQDGLTLAVNDLAKQWEEGQPWYAMVLRNCDKYIYINGGSKMDAGLKKGDIVRVQNVVYKWKKKECESELEGAIDYVGGPVAYARILNVAPTMTTAEIIERDPNYPRSTSQTILPGARVYMEKFFVPETTTAKK